MKRHSQHNQAGNQASGERDNKPPPSSTPSHTTDLYPRYARQLTLPDFGEAAQLQLARSSALMVGLGGLGSAAALYLAAAGIGRLVLADFDSVDVTNLQRQILYRMAEIGRAHV